MKFEFIKPYGYCSGVKRAIVNAFNLKKEYPNKNIYILGDLIHNETVKKTLKENSITTINYDCNNFEKQLSPYINNLDNIFILGAHGHYHDIINFFKKNNLTYIDLTCPIISLINSNLERIDFSKSLVIYIGNKNHTECQNSIKFINTNKIFIYDDISNINFSLIKEDKNIVYFINQSTYSINGLEKLIKINCPHVNYKIINNYCSSLRKRMNALKEIKNSYDALIVLGDKNSSNATKLYNEGKKCFKNNTFFVSTLSEFLSLYKNKFFSNNYEYIGIITATSMDEAEIKKISDFLNNNR